MKSYAETGDISAIGRKLTAEESEKAKILLSIASAKLRTIAKKYGKNLNNIILNDPDLELVAKEIVVKSVLRALDVSENSKPAVTQETQSALGYSASMTYLNAGQSLYFLRNELKELGLIRQKFGALELYGDD